MPAPDGGDDAIRVFGPNEAFCCFVALGNEAFDGGLQLDDGAEHTAFEPSLGHPGEKSLHCIEPGTGRRREVELPAWMPVEPGHHLRMFVSGVIVENGVNDLTRRNLDLDGVEKADELLMTVALHIPPSHGSIEDVEGSKKRCRAVPLVIVRHGSASPPLQRQSRLGAVERLDLAFFIHG